MDDLKKTPLHSSYASRPGVRLVDFGGWLMPLQFETGILAEHRAVRESAGFFDVSHMGEIAVRGSGAEAFLDYLLTNRIAGAECGRCIYSPMCRDDGGTVDDLIVYVLAPENYLLVVNAANTETDFEWIIDTLRRGDWNAEVRDVSDEWAQLALQGPDAAGLIGSIAPGFDPGSLSFYRHRTGVSAAGIEILISRTGYTGEDGFELYCAPERAGELMAAVESAGARPCGLGARDSLRLEARFPLYGHELTPEVGPLEAGLGPFVKLGKPDFRGRGALAAQKRLGIPRRLYGIEMAQPGVPREGYPIFPSRGTDQLGVVTSGGRSPVRGTFIALALLKDDSVAVGDTVEVDIRGRKKTAKVVETPFYRR